MDILDSPIREKTPNPDAFGKIMRRIERVLLGVLVVALLLKLQFFPGASELFILGFTTFAIVYFFVGLAYAFTSKRFPTIGDKAIVAFTCIPLAVASMAMLFRIQMWPFGPMMCYIAAALFVPALALSITAFVGKANLAKATGKWAVQRLVLIALPLWFFVFVGKVGYYEMVGIFRHNPQYMELYRQCHNEGNKSACKDAEAFEDYFFSREGRFDQERVRNGGRVEL